MTYPTQAFLVWALTLLAGVAFGYLLGRATVRHYATVIELTPTEVGVRVQTYAVQVKRGNNGEIS